MHKWLVAGLFIFIIALHTWQLDVIPRGLYVDESSIGLNAALIASTGQDEHGTVFPVFFEAFGEYKNPLYIYAAAVVIKVMGVSEFSLRFTSVLFYAVFLLGWVKLLQATFPKQRSALYVGLWIAGTLPWFFSLSRISFEVISQLAVMTWWLYVVQVTYFQTLRQDRWYYRFFPIWSGTLLGLSAYTYTTARLLTPIVFFLLLVFFYQRQYWLRHVQGILSAAVVLVPLLLFVIQQPSALTQRFREISYWHDPNLTTAEKVSEFGQNAIQYVTPSYLLHRGDSNLRHHSGYGGLILVSVALLAFLGVGDSLFIRKEKKWSVLLIMVLISSILPAALAGGDSSLRALGVGLVISWFAVSGWVTLGKLEPSRLRMLVQGSLIVLLIWESAAYLQHYFFTFPNESVAAFQSYDTRSTLATALQLSSDVIVSIRGNEQYAHAAFYALTLGVSPQQLPVTEPVALPGRCVVVSAFDEFVWYEELYEAQTLYAHSPSDFVKVKCFGHLLSRQ